jgi:hypothetical protein
MHSYRVVWLAVLSIAIATSSLFVAGRVRAQQPQQRLVEEVDIIGNRRLRKDDIIYYIQTRAGDPYNPAQVERDLQTILSQNFFDKVETRVAVEDAPRGGVRVTFYVKELPIIRDIQFEGLKSVSESDVLKTFRERRVGVSKEAIYDPVKVRNGIRVLKELLAAKGHPNATVAEGRDAVSATSVAVTFQVTEGPRVRVAEIEFEGSKVFKSSKLRDQMKYVKEAGLISRFKEEDILDRSKLDYDLHRVDNYMKSKGYLQARHGEPKIADLGPRRTGFPILPLPFISSVDDTLKITVPIIDGKLYRLGEMKIEGNSIFSEQAIKAIIGLQKGDVANGEALSKALFENLKKYYGAQGFIQYTAEVTPTYKDNPQNPNEGVADFAVPMSGSPANQCVVAEWQVSAGNADVVDPLSKRVVLRVNHPQSNHDGGKLVFRATDGYLYFSIGDGGNGNDVGDGHTAGTGNAQDKTNLLGKIMRIDPLPPAETPTSADPISANAKYRVPASNPFVGGAGLDEIFVYGLRNPYRFSFDLPTDRLVAGDVGQNNIEEVDIIERGKNYGWNWYEGELLTTRLAAGTLVSRVTKRKE